MLLVVGGVGARVMLLGLTVQLGWAWYPRGGEGDVFGVLHGALRPVENVMQSSRGGPKLLWGLEVLVGVFEGFPH